MSVQSLHQVNADLTYIYVHALPHHIIVIRHIVLKRHQVPRSNVSAICRQPINCPERLPPRFISNARLRQVSTAFIYELLQNTILGAATLFFQKVWGSDYHKHK